MIFNKQFRKQGKSPNVVTIIDPKTKKEVSYFIEPWIRNRFDNKVLPDLNKNDKDCIIAVDGTEGSGKSILAIQWCKYIDPAFNLSRVVLDRKSTRLNSSHIPLSRMPSSA